MKHSAFGLILFGASLCSGCNTDRADRAAAIKELGEHCHLAFSDADIARIEAKRNQLRAVTHEIIFLGVYGGGPPEHSDCIDSFVSKSGYRFTYGINKPVL